KCPKNEVYSDCVIPCNNCQIRGKCEFIFCNKGCDCRKGYYRDFSGRCIPARQCPIIDPTPPASTCEANKQYYECIPSCDRTCKAYRRKEKIFCNQICISGCFCREGLYLADDGETCVPPEQCDKTPSSPTKKCPKNEVYSDCVIPCNDCQTRGKCNFLVCNKGCDCRKGYYRDFSGRCIPARQCPIIDRWIPSTYQRDTEPRDYQECSQVDGPRVRGMPIPRGCLPKSELLRDFQSELITQLSSVLRSLKPSSRLLMPFLRPSSSLLEHSVFIQPFREWSSAYLFLHWVMVLLVDQQLTFLVVNPYYGKVFECRHHRSIQG
ncbi:hypothetical protein AVEN_91084-1, partial [Araneus ventricosus]